MTREVRHFGHGGFIRRLIIEIWIGYDPSIGGVRQRDAYMWAQHNSVRNDWAWEQHDQKCPDSWL